MGSTHGQQAIGSNPASTKYIHISSINISSLYLEIQLKPVAVQGVALTFQPPRRPSSFAPSFSFIVSFCIINI